LARPDLHVAQAVLTSTSGLTFFLGIAGLGIRSSAIGWKSIDLHRVAYAFFYRLYNPGRFSDPSYKRMDLLEENLVAYTIQIRATTRDGGIQDTALPNLVPLYARSPFGTRTHIFSNPKGPVNVNVAVLKDQLCQHESRFDEHSILSHIHSAGNVPGVIEEVYHETLEVPFCTSRRKYRMGMQHLGQEFMTIPTPQQMLEIVFDILEGNFISVIDIMLCVHTFTVLRYLRFERSVLHRDISKGNVMYFGDNLTPFTGATSGGADETVGPKELPLCFIKYLLGERYVEVLPMRNWVDSNVRPNQAMSPATRRRYSSTSIVRNTSKAKRVLILRESPEQFVASHLFYVLLSFATSQGTPIFIARGVEHGGPVPSPNRPCVVPEVPGAPEPYASHHPDRIQQFPFAPNLLFIPEMSSTDDINNRQWRHELDHDTESVFWLILYWAVCVQPQDGPKEAIDAMIWGGLMGPVESRSNLLKSDFKHATHSIYRPLESLLSKLAAILVVDRNWLESSDPRNNAGYANEAFQRLILQFILDHRQDTFMKTKVDRELRHPKRTPQSQSRTDTSSKILHDYIRDSRSSHSPSRPRSKTKRSSVNAKTDGTTLEVGR